MLEPECYDPILARCPTCKKLFQPEKPMEVEFISAVTKGKLAAECPNHDWPEIIED
jgi:hypothetical protein